MPIDRASHTPRYLKALSSRLRKALGSPDSERACAARLGPLVERLKTLDRRAVVDSAALESYAWMLEEFQVSLFDQRLGTAMPSSEKRLQRLWDQAVQTASRRR